MTYFSDILNEAANNYIKLKQAKEIPKDVEEEEPREQHPYDALLENRTAYHEMSDAAKERQFRLI